MARFLWGSGSGRFSGIVFRGGVAVRFLFLVVLVLVLVVLPSCISASSLA